MSDAEFYAVNVAAILISVGAVLWAMLRRPACCKDYAHFKGYAARNQSEHDRFVEMVNAINARLDAIPPYTPTVQTPQTKVPKRKKST